MDTNSTTPKSGVYEIRNIVNGKRYVGSAVNLRGRINTHKYWLRKRKHSNKHLQNAWNKYGEDKFIFNVLFYCAVESRVQYEQRVIDGWRLVETGYNIRAKAESNLGVRVSEEARDRMRLAQVGKTMSKEAREKIKLALMGTHRSEETKKKLALKSMGNTNGSGKRTRSFCRQVARIHRGNKYRLGKYHTEEAKRKMSIGHLGQVAWNKGKPCSKATRLKISKANKGRPGSNLGRKFSEEARRNMSLAHLKRSA